MWEFFWFAAGGLAYSVISNLDFFSKKAQFVEDIRIIAFELIGRAYEDLVSIRAIKYKFLIKDSSIDSERITAFKNEDDNFMEKWQKETLNKLNNAVPPLYRASLDAQTWKLLMNHLNKYYRKTIIEAKKEESND